MSFFRSRRASSASKELRESTLQNISLPELRELAADMLKTDAEQSKRLDKALKRFEKKGKGLHDRVDARYWLESLNAIDEIIDKITDPQVTDAAYLRIVNTMTSTYAQNKWEFAGIPDRRRLFDYINKISSDKIRDPVLANTVLDHWVSFLNKQGIGDIPARVDIFVSKIANPDMAEDLRQKLLAITVNKLASDYYFEDNSPIFEIAGLIKDQTLRDKCYSNIAFYLFERVWTNYGSSYRHDADGPDHDPELRIREIKAQDKVDYTYARMIQHIIDLHSHVESKKPLEEATRMLDNIADSETASRCRNAIVKSFGEDLTDNVTADLLLKCATDPSDIRNTARRIAHLAEIAVTKTLKGQLPLDLAQKIVDAIPDEEQVKRETLSDLLARSVLKATYRETITKLENGHSS